jgi:GTP cyclohydrolase I
VQIFKDDKKTETTKNYDITYEYGTLTVVQRTLKVKTHDLTWVFNNESHYDSQDGTLAYGASDVIDIDDINYYGICDGHEFKVIESTPVKYVVDSGVQNNVITLRIFEKGVDLTENYAIEYEFGDLTILPRPIKVKTHNLTWVYNNQDHFDETVYNAEDVIGIDNINYYGICYGHEFEIVDYTTVKYVKDSGSANNSIKLEIYEQEENLTENYAIEYVLGDLTITQRNIKVKTHNLTWVYDNQDHFDKTVYNAEDIIDIDNINYYGICDGHEFKIVDYTTVKYVKDSGSANNSIKLEI